MTLPRRFLAALGLVLALAASAQAGLLQGTVSHVSDGDTLWVRPRPGAEAVAVRILDIDAPETCQRYGPEAKQALAARVLHQPVRVLTRGQDDYGRTLGQVRQRGQDVGAWMVRNGHAWSMTFRDQPGPYEQLQARARAQRRGLWADARAIEPRSYRRRFGLCR